MHSAPPPGSTSGTCHSGSPSDRLTGRPKGAPGQDPFVIQATGTLIMANDLGAELPEGIALARRPEAPGMITALFPAAST
jgi:hypothetical protein